MKILGETHEASKGARRVPREGRVWGRRRKEVEGGVRGGRGSPEAHPGRAIYVLGRPIGGHNTGSYVIHYPRVASAQQRSWEGVGTLHAVNSGRVDSEGLENRQRVIVKGEHHAIMDVGRWEVSGRAGEPKG